MNKLEKMKDLVIHALNERGSRYGSFKDNSRLAFDLKKDIFESPNRENSNISKSEKEAIVNIIGKISRISTGEPRYEDNYIDILGFASLIANGNNFNESIKEYKLKTLKEYNPKLEDSIIASLDLFITKIKEITRNRDLNTRLLLWKNFVTLVELSTCNIIEGKSFDQIGKSFLSRLFYNLRISSKTIYIKIKRYIKENFFKWN